MENDDSLLVRDFKNGQIEAYNGIVRKYGKRLYAVIYGMTKDHKMTDDLLQETFIKVYYSIHTFKEEYPFYPWIYRIAVNLTLNYLRKEHRSIKISIDAEETQIDSEISLSSMPVETVNPEKALVSRELMDEVNRALMKLSPSMRAVLALRIFDGRTYQEISQILKCSMGTVMSRLNRAREKMKYFLGDYVKDCIERPHAQAR